jgi:heavy metal translocating P-type ATPase
MTPAILDESTLTGEANPVERAEGSPLKSGVVNTGSPFDMTATATVEASTYEAIVRLVREAQASKGPFIRMADRFAVLFLPATLGVAGAAWAFSGDPVRALAVLVVATPCPLILAAPVAWVSGLSRLAQQGVIVKGSSALEALGEVEILMMDKTGTLTEGTPRIAATESTDIETSELLRLAASLDQVSHHPYAAAIVKAAQERGMNLSFPQDTSEQLGTGINGLVDGRLVAVGKAEWVFPDGLSPRLRDIRRLATLEGRANVFVSVEGSEGGALILDDPLRPDAVATVRLLRHAGIRRVVLVTGDHPAVADMIGNAIGADSILSERSPEGKAEAVAEEKSGGKTVMVGDGINDAPALAMADVGVALGARGAAAHSEAADVVLTVDRIDRLADAILIAQRSRRIALQSVVAGMALSSIAMLFAAAGLLEPVAGAVVQEAIDVAVILNALRALRSGNRRVKVSHPELGDALSAPPA